MMGEERRRCQNRPSSSKKKERKKKTGAGAAKGEEEGDKKQVDPHEEGTLNARKEHFLVRRCLCMAVSGGACMVITRRGFFLSLSYSHR